MNEEKRIMRKKIKKIFNKNEFQNIYLVFHLLGVWGSILKDLQVGA